MIIGLIILIMILAAVLDEWITIIEDMIDNTPIER